MKPKKIEYRQINKSSTVDGVAYNEQEKILSVRFKTGDEYQYRGVTPQMARQFEQSKSMGQFVHKYFKGKFPMRKL